MAGSAQNLVVEIFLQARYDKSILRYGDVGDPFRYWVMISEAEDDDGVSLLMEVV